MGIISTLRNLFSRREEAYDKRGSKGPHREIDHNHDRKDSQTTNSSVTSPTSSTRNANSSNGYSFQYKDGRRYHADTDVAYVLPNDDDEVDRVHQQHWIFKYALQGNYFAPVKDKLLEGIVVLDSGCGPATWTFEMGENYPRSTFHGVDASCVFPEDIKPGNVEFMLCNIAKEVPYEDNYFDYIHQRLLILGLTSEDWTNALDNLFRVLKPGCYLELAEPDMRHLKDAGPAMKVLQTMLTKMSTDRGIPLGISVELKDRLAKAGFVDIEEKITNIPLNHGGKVGKLLWEDYHHGYKNVRGVLAKNKPEWEDTEVYEAHLQECAVECKKSKAVFIWHSIYCRKPEETTTQ